MARRLADERLRKSEIEAGWVSFHCPDHGFLVAMKPTATVRCGNPSKTEPGARCNKLARKVPWTEETR